MTAPDIGETTDARSRAELAGMSEAVKGADPASLAANTTSVVRPLGASCRCGFPTAVSSVSRRGPTRRT
jgi:hypothetical protein